MPNTYHIAKPGEEASGPFTAEQIAVLWLSAQITADTKVWLDRTKEWLPCDLEFLQSEDNFFTEQTYHIIEENSAGKEQRGPYTAAQIHSLINTGEITWDWYLWQTVAWIPLRDTFLNANSAVGQIRTQQIRQQQLQVVAAAAGEAIAITGILWVIGIIVFLFLGWLLFKILLAIM